MGGEIDVLIRRIYAVRPEELSGEERAGLWNACGMLIGKIKQAGRPAEPQKN